VCALAFGVTTVTANDRYAPHNVGAIWIATAEVCVTFAEQPTFPGMPTHEACVNFEVGAGSFDTLPPDQPNFVSMHLVYE
jgi:hypothetical protein